MKVFVFAYNRYDTMTTPDALGDIPHTVLCHSEEDREKFIAGGRVQEKNLVATGNPKGLTYNFNAALDLMDVGEWATFLVDDWVRCEQLEDYDAHSLAGYVDVSIENQKEWNAKFRNVVPMSEFILRCEEAARYCEKMGSNLAGFSSHGNVPWRGMKWKSNVFVDGRAWVIRKTHLRFDENVQMQIDTSWTAMNIEAFGSVLVNQWVVPICQRYSAGSYGSIEDRLEQKTRECAYLVKTHPVFVTYRKKKGWPDGTHIGMRRLSSQSAKW